jgi:hypothetical protein
MALLRRLRAYAGLLRRRGRGQPQPAAVRYLLRRPALAAAIGAYETALLVSNRADLRAKTLATLQAARLAGCPL